MARPYLVGWGYALRAFFKSYRKSKIQRKIWRQLVHKKHYWLTTEERIESHRKCLGALGELGKIIFPDVIKQTNKEIILEYCDNVQTGDMDHLQSCIDVRNALRNTNIDHNELLNRLDGSCASSVGLDDYEGLCYETDGDHLCKRCWEKVLA